MACEYYHSPVGVLKICSDGKAVTEIRISENGIPLYDCNFNYTMESSHVARIEIPDNPEKEFAINFSSDSDAEISIQLDVWSEKDGMIVHTYKNPVFSGKKEDDNART